MTTQHDPWPYVVCWVIFFFITQFLWNRFGRVSTIFDFFNQSQKTEWPQRGNSLIHALTALPLATYVLFMDSVLDTDRFFTTSLTSFHVLSFSTGYFLWDTWESLITWEVSGIGFITHGVLCSFIYLISLYPFGHYWALAFLMFETSTPFINVHWLMTNVEPLKKWKITLSVNDILGGIAFFCFRIVYGTFMSYQFWMQSLATLPILSPFLSICLYFILATNIALNSLNYFWFAKIIFFVISGRREEKFKND